MGILRLVCEGLGLRRRPDCFVGDISGGRIVVDLNYYPPSPNPSRTLGLPPHCDQDLITVLLPGAVPGLEIAYNGWIRVQPVPNSLVVNFDLQLEETVVTNGLLKGVLHRAGAATNSAAPRLSVATFIVPADDCVVGPDEKFVSEGNPPRYSTMSVGEFKLAQCCQPGVLDQSERWRQEQPEGDCEAKPGLVYSMKRLCLTRTERPSLMPSFITVSSKSP
ncbi:unnamed protein product [Urochloa humidicola]